ncbi:TpHN family protein [Theileria parva strain Muguga]|uniref:Tash1 protein, putative n=1 Tax=Theileria parva TaxID=5875 RepID=Q4N860_THEPA|nr:uncharacterized protein TpMuguga_01g00610 [Theileria parva strain Muguga]EAN33848.1 TpHN family protein [Theileria parva strain Muguga]|eukprot:XP_766131.1 hypothetical protein [Theileria parva strain Muguga]
MVRLNILLLLYAGFLYHIKSVYSNTLNIQIIADSGFFTIKVYENGITKIMVFSTADKPITEVRQGPKSIWDSLPGESIKCLTYYQFKGSNRKLMTIEINNPVKDEMYYLHIHNYNYVYATKEMFEFEYTEMARVAKYMHEKYSKSSDKVPIPKQKQPKKRKADTDDTGGSKKKTPAVSEKIEPDIVQVEVESEEDESTDTASEGPIEDQKQERKDLMERINFVVSSDSDNDINELEVPFDPSIKTNPSEPEITQVEMGSDDDDSDLLNESLFGEDVEKWLESELEDIGLSESERDSLFEDTTGDVTGDDESSND